MRTKVSLPIDVAGLYSLKMNYPHVVSEVELPEGWRRVWRGRIKPADRYLNLALWYDNLVVWEDVGKPRGMYAQAQRYACLIREELEGPDLPCEHCELKPRETGYRYCADCIYSGAYKPKQE